MIQKVKEANSDRKWKAPNHTFTGASDDSEELCENPALEIDYIVASPRMALYMEYSTKIYNIYLKYIAPEDIHIYSIDEVFMDVTNYLAAYNLTPEELAMKMIRDVLRQPELRQPQESEPICILAKLQWILWQSILNLIRMECGLPDWMKCLTGSFYGVTDRLQISGGSEAAMQRSLQKMDCIQWAILQDVP